MLKIVTSVSYTHLDVYKRQGPGQSSDTMRAGRIVAISCRRVCRSYSSVSSKIGARFVSAKEIDSYLSKVSWNIQDYVPTRVDKRLLPAKETVIRLLRISGLPERDLGPVQRRLANQLSFIDHLHSLPVDESINANHARILHRLSLIHI